MSATTRARRIAGPRLLLAIAAISSVSVALPRGGVVDAVAVNGPTDFPFVYPMNGHIYSWSGPSPTHEGYDIFGHGTHTPVYAAHSGYVSEAAFQTATCYNDNNTPVGLTAGNYVVIQHGTASSGVGYSSTYTRYHHLNSLAVAPNRWVAAGDLIGYEGCTGRANQSEHLHLEFRSTAGTAYKIADFPAVDFDATAGSPIGFDGQWGLATGTSSTATKTVYFGQRGDVPVTGDWDGDGYETLGVVRYDVGTGQLIWIQSATNLNSAANGTTATASTLFFYGVAGDIPITGDWDGNGSDTIGVVRTTVDPVVGAPTDRYRNYYLRNANSGGASTITRWGSWPGRYPVVGDWNGDGQDSPGLFYVDNATWHLTDTTFATTNTHAHTPFAFGQNADVPLPAHYALSTRDHPIVYQKNPNAGGVNLRWFKRASYTAGAHTVHSFGSLGVYPKVLDWDSDPYDEYAILF